MSEVMISYCHANSEYARWLFDVLGNNGCPAWYDKSLRGSDDVANTINSIIEDAPAVVVVWSKEAANSDYVKAEALLAFDQGKLILVRCDDHKVGVPFNGRKYLDLVGWRGDPNDPRLADLLAAVGKFVKPDGANPSTPASPAATQEESTRLADAKAFLEAHKPIKIDGQRIFARGRVADVYRGQYGKRGGRPLAIKAIRNSRLSPEQSERLFQEIATISNLNHPCFLRVDDVLLHHDTCYIISDLVSGAKPIDRKLKTGAANPFTLDDVVHIMNQLCEATLEAQVKGVNYLSINPAQVFVSDDRTLVLAGVEEKTPIPKGAKKKGATRMLVRMSPLNFAYFREGPIENVARWDDPMCAFFAPELWLGNRWFNKRLGQDLHGVELNRRMIETSHQFALGMLAWTMIEGRMPFGPIAGTSGAKEMSPQDMRDEFVEQSEGFSTRVAGAPWRGQARALARIVERMVAFNPAERWEDLEQVRLLFGSLAANVAANDVEDTVKAAYGQVFERGKEFSAKFYEELFRLAPTLRDKFPADMARQFGMLEHALGQLLNYNQQQEEPTTLTQFVQAHRRLGLSQEDFVHFGEALIKTFEAELPPNAARQRTMAALEIIIWPGIFYMMQQCGPAQPAN